MARRLKRFPVSGPKLLVTVLLAAALSAFVVAPGQASLSEGSRIHIRMVNNSKTYITAEYCPKGHVSIHYKFGTHHNPCSVITETRHLYGSGDRNTYTSNPVGIIIKGNHKTLYLYARNPSVGRPFFELNGQHVTLYEGQLETRHALGATIRFHREGDISGGLFNESFKNMTIEIISMG